MAEEKKEKKEEAVAAEEEEHECEECPPKGAPAWMATFEIVPVISPRSTASANTISQGRPWLDCGHDRTYGRPLCSTVLVPCC